ncbi:fumarylacetoacetase [Alteromonas sp. 14N.309.X.WAT.G.H12]|uniref:fumarylacetoacetase n=1 Tax=Alteromonas sp. 14N.309.X.WAT.G.H12 TaxID=3120824 RepID=UPI002FD0A13C
MESDTDNTTNLVLLDETHDVHLQSWLACANQHPDYPIQNLPMGVFKQTGTSARCGVAIGDYIIDLHALAQQNPFSGLASDALKTLTGSTLNAFMALDKAYSRAFRLALSQVLRKGAREETLIRNTLVDANDVHMCMPCEIKDYTDFYTSIYHATSVGKLFRPDNPLLPNYQWLPIGYHGRASSIQLSGTPVKRPLGQRLNQQEQPELGPTKKLDYEVELGIFVGRPSTQFQPISMAQAESHFFGVCMLNDWSARDIQAWEYQPLGPFLSKNFITTISPWITTAEALAPFRTSPTEYESRPYVDALNSTSNTQAGALDIKMCCTLQTEKMRTDKLPPMKLSETSFKHAFWTIAQMISHHTQTGCNLNAGDLFGSGTQSGPTPDEAGSLLELTEGGKLPLQLPNGEQRTFLEDGDIIEIRGYCTAPSGLRLSIGTVTSHVLSSEKNNIFHSTAEATS